MGKYRVPQWGKPQGFVTVDSDATVGATFGVDLRWPDGNIVKAEDFQQGVADPESQPPLGASLVLSEAADDAAAASAGVAVGSLYRSGSLVKIRIA